MSIAALPVLDNPDPGVTYQAAYDALGKAYWDATDINCKDLIYGAQQAIGIMITAIDEQQLATNTDLFIQLTPKIKSINSALNKIEDQINTITKNLETVATVLSAITKVLSLYPAL